MDANPDITIGLELIQLDACVTISLELTVAPVLDTTSITPARNVGLLGELASHSIVGVTK